MPSPLPRYHLPFIGREATLQTMTESLQHDRVLTLLGPGGVGKTRLAVRFSEDWPGPVRFVDLQSAENAADVRQLVAHEVGAQIQDPIVNRIQALNRPLLVLDNLEQVSDEAAPLIAEWSGGASEARFLVTSRRPLSLSCEHRLSVHPFPTESEDPTSSEAAQIFLSAAPPHVRVDATLVELLTALDGLPLALQLAAARLEVLTMPQLAEQLRTRRFALLRHPGREGHRHDSLWSTIRWSWQQLSPPLQALLQQCAIFEGRFALEDAEQVIAGESILDGLHTLCRRHLLSFNGERFALLVSIRAFLRQHPPAPDLVSRYTAWCLERARHHFERLSSAEVITALDGLAMLFPDLRALIRSGQEAAWEAMIYMAGLLNVRGDRPERLRLIQALLARPDDSPHRAHLMVTQADWEYRGGDVVTAQRLVAAVLADPTSPPEVCAYALLESSHHLDRSEQLSEIVALYEQALPLAVKLPYLVCSLRASHALAIHDCYDYPRARELGWAAVAYGREQGLHGPTGHALNQLGNILLEQERHGEAAEVLGEALEIYTGNNTRKCGHITGLLALIKENAGELDTALAGYREAVSMLRSTGEARLWGHYQGYIGRILLMQGHREEAEPMLLLTSSFPEAHLWHAASRAWVGDVDAVTSRLREATSPSARSTLALILLAAEAQADPEAHRDVLASMRALLPEVVDAGDVVISKRLGALAIQIAEQALSAWLISADGSWFCPPDGSRVSLARRPIHARILAAMLAARHQAPGSVLSLADIKASGWPGEAMMTSSAANRVRVALSGLRRAGLAALMVRSDGGWGLDGAVQIRTISLEDR